MKFRFKSKYNGFYFGVVDTISVVVSEYVYFYSEKNIGYRSDEVEWLDEIRDEKLKDLGI